MRPWTHVCFLTQLLLFCSQVDIFCPWSPTAVEAELHFLLPFSAAFKLHTANVRKFLQVRLSDH